MKNFLKNFSFPYKNIILIISVLVLVVPPFILIFPKVEPLFHPDKFKVILFLSTLIANIGFIYSTLGYHFQILKGDELKLKIHLESLNIAFTTTLVFFFILSFVFINFAPKMLNYILLFLVVIGILAYVLGVEFVKEKYE